MSNGSSTYETVNDVKDHFISSLVMFIKSLTFAYWPQSSTLETNSSTSSTVQSRSDWFFGVLFKLADGDTDLPSSASSGSSFHQAAQMLPM